MNKIRQTLISVLNSEPTNSTNYRIAKYLLHNHYIANRVSMDEVAQNCFCAKSTVSRFARQIGYSNYYELNQDLYQSFRYNQNKYSAYFHYDFQTSKDIFLGTLIHMANQLATSIREDDITRLVDDLIQYENVAIFGNSQSHSMAQLFQNDMCLSRKIITASTLPDHQQQYIQEGNQSNLIIILSFSGQYFRQFISRYLFNKENKPKIVLITCEKKMLYSHCYDDIIYIEAQDNYAYRSHVINTYLNIVAIEYARKINKGTSA